MGHQSRRLGDRCRHATAKMDKGIRILTAVCGLLSVSVFVCSFMIFCFLHPGFDILGDFISKLGSKGQPYAICWNVSGFATVGLLLATFGWLFGLCQGDRVLGACLVVSGVGFTLAAIPADFADAQAPLSKAHFVSVCLSLAGFCFGLARLSGSRSTKQDRNIANVVIVLAIIPVVCVSGGVSAEPIAHRIILAVVFTWVVLSSIRLLRPDPTVEFVR